MQQLSGTIYDVDKVPPNNPDADPQETQVVAGDETTFSQNLQSKDPQEGMTFKSESQPVGKMADL